MRRLALLALAAILASSCAAAVEAATPNTPTPRATTQTIVVNGQSRTYRLFVPSPLPRGSVPLFIGLHGGTGSANQFARTNRIEALAADRGFLVVHPDGTRIGRTQGRVWNGGMCCGPAARDDVDDVAFVEAVVDDVERRFDVDPDRVFAFGHSNGGIMSYRLACELAGRIAGIGVVAGTVGVDACVPDEPVSVLHVHGSDDENLPIDGGRGPRSIAGVSFPSPLDEFADLAATQGCDEPSTTTSGQVTTELRSPCDGGAVMAFVTLEGAGHAWPGGGYDATAELVDFLLDNPANRRQLA